MQKEAEKKLKYKSLCIEIQRVCNLKCTIVPVIIGATGVVTRSLKKNLETVPGKHSIDSLQKTAIFGTSHIIRKVLQCEAWSLSGGDHRWFKRSTRKKCLWQETCILYNNNTHRLTPECQGGSPSPFDTYDTRLELFCLKEPFILALT